MRLSSRPSSLQAGLRALTAKAPSPLWSDQDLQTASKDTSEDLGIRICNRTYELENISKIPILCITTEREINSTSQNKVMKHINNRKVSISVIRQRGSVNIHYQLNAFRGSQMLHTMNQRDWILLELIILACLTRVIPTKLPSKLGFPEVWQMDEWTKGRRPNQSCPFSISLLWGGRRSDRSKCHLQSWVEMRCDNLLVLLIRWHSKLLHGNHGKVFF